MFNIKSKQLFLLVFLSCLFLIAFALYLQYFQNLAPCPLCMLQRVVFVSIGLVALVAFLHNPTIYGLRVYGLLNSALSIMGLGLAGRQLWIESLPPNLVPACGPSLEVMLQYLPLFDALKAAMMGSGDCAKINWEMFGMSIATWSFICLAGLLIINLNVVFKPVGRL